MTVPTPHVLPIEGTPTFADNAWSVRLPVRAEHISVSKHVVVRERVVVKRNRIAEVARVEAQLRREQLRARRSGPVEIIENSHTDIDGK